MDQKLSQCKSPPNLLISVRSQAREKEVILFPYVRPSNEANYNGSSKVEMAYISTAVENGIYFCYSGSVWIVFTSPSHIVL